MLLSELAQKIQFSFVVAIQSNLDKIVQYLHNIGIFFNLHVAIKKSEISLLAYSC